MFRTLASTVRRLIIPVAAAHSAVADQAAVTTAGHRAEVQAGQTNNHFGGGIMKVEMNREEIIAALEHHVSTAICSGMKLALIDNEYQMPHRAEFAMVTLEEYNKAKEKGGEA